jgi:hypothetical protein
VLPDGIPGLFVDQQMQIQWIGRRPLQKCSARSHGICS